jgi:hypothetical protein
MYIIRRCFLLKRHITCGIHNSLKRLKFDVVVFFATHKEFAICPVQEDGWAFEGLTPSDSIVELRFVIGVIVHHQRHGLNYWILWVGYIVYLSVSHTLSVQRNMRSLFVYA